MNRDAIHNPESCSDQFADENELPDMDALQKLPFIGHSTKVSWLIRFLKETLQRSVSDKIVVVTQFVDLLLVISNVLSTINIRHSSCKFNRLKLFQGYSIKMKY